MTHRDLADRSPWPWVREPEGELYRLAVALIARTRDEAEAARCRFRLLIFPSHAGAALAARGTPVWEAMLRDLQDRGIEVLDLTAAVLEAGGSSNPALWAPAQHYSAEGNQVVAAAILDWLDAS